jgi:hypothetical protein
MTRRCLLLLVLLLNSLLDGMEAKPMSSFIIGARYVKIDFCTCVEHGKWKVCLDPMCTIKL